MENIPFPDIRKLLLNKRIYTAPLRKNPLALVNLGKGIRDGTASSHGAENSTE